MDWGGTNIGQKVAQDEPYLNENMSMHLRVRAARGIVMITSQRGKGEQLTTFIRGVRSKDQVAVEEGETVFVSA